MRAITARGRVSESRADPHLQRRTPAPKLVRNADTRGPCRRSLRASASRSRRLSSVVCWWLQSASSPEGVPRPACRRCDPGEHHEFRATAVAHRRRSIGGGCEALRRGNLPGLRSVVGLIACRFSRSRRLAMRSGRNTMNSVAAVVADHACPLPETASHWALVSQLSK